MNAKGDCTDSYRRGVIRAYVRRAVKHCSTWQLVDRELKRVKQMLINNEYSNSDFDDISRDMIDKHMTTSNTAPNTPNTTPNNIDVYLLQKHPHTILEERREGDTRHHL